MKDIFSYFVLASALLSLMFFVKNSCQYSEKNVNKIKNNKERNMCY